MAYSASPAQDRQRSVAVLATDSVNLSSMHIFCDLFRGADALIGECEPSWEGGSRPGAGKRKRPVKFKILSADGAPVRSSCGTLVQVDKSMGDVRSLDLLIVPSSSPPGKVDLAALPPREAMLPDFITRIWNGGAMVAAGGTGVGKLALSGILDGRAATIGPEYRKGFRRQFPAVRLENARQITEDSNIFCANSIGAQINLACRLLARVNSNRVGEVMGRLSLSYLSNIISPKFLAMMEPAAPGDLVVSNSVFWIARNYSQQFRTADLARALCVSERTLLRRFQEAMQVTPHSYMRQLRLDTAARELRTTNLTVEAIAMNVGYSTVDFFKKIFRKQYGLSPTAYRRSLLSENREG